MANLAGFYAMGGDLDGAAAWLERAAREEGVTLAKAYQDKHLKPLRQDERWDDLRPIIEAMSEHWTANPVPSEVLVSHVREDGAGPALIWLHGAGRSPQDPPGRLHELCERTGVALVMVGGPNSHGPRTFWWTTPAAKNVDHVREAIADLAFEPLFIGGFSQGAGVAAEMIGRHPDNFAGGIVVSSPGGASIDWAAGRAPMPVFVAGEAEPWVVPANARDIADAFERLDHPVTREVGGYEGHRLPPDFVDRASEVIQAGL